MEMNFPIIALAALIPLITGFIWYNPKLFGTAWMKAAGLNEESMKGFNMAKVFILTYVLSFILASVLQTYVIHQFAIYSILMNESGMQDPNSDVSMMLKEFMEKYGNNFRGFSHGITHGMIAGIFLVMPVLAINAMFERKGFAYIAINSGYWIVCLGLMGGVLCAWV